MKFMGLSALVVGTLLLASPAAADVHLTIDNGHVSLSASNATVRQILAEWAKVGQTKIVNAERVPGGPLTIELTNVSEVEALEIILRSVSGYLLAQRPVPTPNASKYDRILIVPTSSAARPSAPPASAIRQPNIAAQGRPPEEEPDDTPENPTQPVVAPAARPPVFNTFPQPQPASPPPPRSQPSAPVPTTTPSAAPGVPVPGMVIPPPQEQPGLPSPGTPQL